jgi:Zn-dependent peptidase ImmA (M78 family)/transcriptional regulator with XRE-family HTH domain
MGPSLGCGTLARMISPSEALEEARAELALPRDTFAEVIGVSPEDLDRAERGDADAGRAALRGAAEIFGLDVSELLNQGIAGRASTTMLRSFIDHAPDTAFNDLVQRGVHRELGSFVRHLRRKAWLHDALGRPRPSLPPELHAEAIPIAASSHPPHGADHLAALVRTQLGLGDEPISSMLSLVRDRLNIEVHFTNTLWSRIDGASASTERARGILVNLAEDGRRWWRTRTTLAHELCHLLYDGGALAGTRGGPLLIFSPAARRSGPSEDGYEPRFGQGHTSFLKIEQRANAFAAYLLAPPTGVRGLFAESEPARTCETVSRVARHFGLSPLTAINVLKNVYRWSDQDRYVLMDEIDAEGLELDREHPDVVAALPPEDAELRALSDAAVSAGLLFPSTRDRWLGVVDPPSPEESSRTERRPLRACDEVAAEVRELLSRGQVDASLRALWSAVDAWIDARELEQCRGLIRALPPSAVDSNVMVSLLAALARAPELADARAAYRREARCALQESGRTREDVDALVGGEVME